MEAVPEQRSPGDTARRKGPTESTLHIFTSSNTYNDPTEHTLLFSLVYRRGSGGRESSSNGPGLAAFKWHSQNLRPSQLASGFVSLTARLYCLSLTKQKSVFLGHQNQIIWGQETDHSLHRRVKGLGRRALSFVDAGTLNSLFANWPKYGWKVRV